MVHYSLIMVISDKEIHCEGDVYAYSNKDPNELKEGSMYVEGDLKTEDVVAFAGQLRRRVLSNKNLFKGYEIRYLKDNPESSVKVNELHVSGNIELLD